MWKRYILFFFSFLFCGCYKKTDIENNNLSINYTVTNISDLEDNSSYINKMYLKFKKYNDVNDIIINLKDNGYKVFTVNGLLEFKKMKETEWVIMI